MHAQIMLGAQGPRLPQKLHDGLLRGIGDARQCRGKAVLRVRVQVVAVPLAVGHGDVDVLRLIRVVGRKGQQLQGFQPGKRRPQVPVQKSEGLLPRGGVFARRDAARLRGGSKRARMGTILRHTRDIYSYRPTQAG